MSGPKFIGRIKDLLISLIVVTTIVLFLLIPFFYPGLSIYVTIIAWELRWRCRSTSPASSATLSSGGPAI